MKVSKDVLIQAANQCSTFEELAEKVGWLKGVAEEKMEGMLERFVETAAGVCPGLELLLDRT